LLDGLLRRKALQPAGDRAAEPLVGGNLAVAVYYRFTTPLLAASTATAKNPIIRFADCLLERFR